MSDKPILTIEIDDSEFKSFVEMYDRFKAEVAKQPAAWKEISKWSQKIGGDFAAMNKALKPTKTEEAPVDNWNAFDLSWSSITNSSKLFFNNIKGATFSLTKWSGLTAAFSGLISAGGLFGIERMAGSVSSRRTNAAGLGVSYGERSSFLTNFGRLGNAEGLLTGFNRALVDTESRAPLYALGGANAKNAGSAFAEALPSIKRILDATDPRTLQDTIAARQWDKLGIDINTAQIIKNMKPEEIQAMIANWKEDTGPMGLDTQTTRGWADFNAQMEAAGKEIETHFAREVSILTPGLTRASESITTIIEKLLKESGPIAKWLKEINKGITNFARDISDKKFDADVDSFLTSVGNFGRMLANINLDRVNSFLDFFKLKGHGENGPSQRGDPKRGISGSMGSPEEYLKNNPDVDPNQFGRAKLRDAFNRGARGPRRPEGAVALGLKQIEEDTADLPGGRAKISAENDAFHQKLPYDSAHSRGLAFDQVLKDKSKHAEAAEFMRQKLEGAGLSPKDYRIIDEYAHPSPFSTGGHIHTQFNSPEAASKYYVAGSPKYKNNDQHKTVIRQDDGGGTTIKRSTQEYGARTGP